MSDYTLKHAFEELEKTLVKNVANHIIQYTFHEHATDEELVAYYGGTHVNREALLDDTVNRLVGDQMILRFIRSHAKEINKYATKDAAGDIGITLKRSARISAEPDSVSADAEEDAVGPDTDQGDESGDSPDGGSNSGEAPKGHGEGAGLGDQATPGVPGDAK